MQNGAAHDDYRLLHLAAYGALFCVGMYAASFGPALPFLAADLDISLDTAGLTLTALFIGSIAASASVAIALHRRDPWLLTATGLCCTIAGTLALGFAPTWPLALTGGVVLGTGDGLIVAALHILIAATARDAARGINSLNFFFAGGALVGPLWAGGVLEAGWGRGVVYGGIALTEAVALVALIAARGPRHERRPADDEPFRLPGNATAWTMGIVLFLYVGAEFGLGSWVSSYARETADASVFEGALLASGYWGALALGRVASTAYLDRSRDISLLLALSIAGAGLASLALIASSGQIVLSAGAAFAVGLFLGPVWPSTLSIASQGALANATATTVTMGNAGGVVIPWLQGRVLVDAGPGEGVAVTAALCAVMLLVVVGFRTRERRI